MEDRIERIIKRWFVTEPALFAVICSHEIAGNVKMRCPVRSGGGRIECNPDFVREMSDDALEEALRTEVLRIMLKHPYERRPDGCRGEAMVFGSNLVISDNYTFSRFNLQTADGSGFEAGLSYEAYSRKVEKAMEEGVIPSGDPSLRDVSELWDDDPLQIALVNGVLEGIKDWGSLTGDLLESVKASSLTSINWKNVLAGFRSSVLSMDRRLTRMRPSRRTGFENMGSVRRFTSRILVALDVSGSVSSEALGYFWALPTARSSTESRRLTSSCSRCMSRSKTGSDMPSRKLLRSAVEERISRCRWTMRRKEATTVWSLSRTERLPHPSFPTISRRRSCGSAKVRRRTGKIPAGCPAPAGSAR